jgi:hypothetical protein
MLIEPKELPLTRQDGQTVTFLISKFPAVAGREIVAKYPVANMPKLGDYGVSEETMLKALAFVAVVTPDGTPLPLSTRALVDNHAGDWETLARLEWGILEYNCSFFGKGLNSDFLENIKTKVQASISPTLTDLLGRLLQAVKQPSTS